LQLLIVELFWFFFHLLWFFYVILKDETAFVLINMRCRRGHMTVALALLGYVMLNETGL
jgi:hypothetical protein